MDGMFINANTFNQDISEWKVDNVESMKEMFYGAAKFNQPLGSWNVEKLRICPQCSVDLHLIATLALGNPTV